MKQYLTSLPFVQILLTYVIGGAFGVLAGFFSVVGISGPGWYLVLGLAGLLALVLIWLPWPVWFKHFDDQVDLIPKQKEA